MKPYTIALPVLAIAVIASATVYVKYDEWIVFPKHRATLKNILKDPGSAQFKGEFISSMGWYCGEVNSKNGLGGYTGYERFISSKDETHLESQWFVGAGPEPFNQAHKRIIAELDERTNIAIKANELNSAGKIDEAKKLRQSSTESNIRSSVIKKFFQEKWSQVCTW